MHVEYECGAKEDGMTGMTMRERKDNRHSCGGARSYTSMSNKWNNAHYMRPTEIDSAHYKI